MSDPGPQESLFGEDRRAFDERQAALDEQLILGGSKVRDGNLFRSPIRNTSRAGQPEPRYEPGTGRPLPVRLARFGWPTG